MDGGVQELLIGHKVRLRQKCLGDVFDDYAWRRDAELSRLSATTPLLGSFADYLKSYAEEPRCLGKGHRRFAIESMDGKHIGNCAYFNVDNTTGEAELGIVIGERAYWNYGYGADVVTTLLDYIFSQTKLNRIYLRTLGRNVRARRCFEKCGFIPHGQFIWEGCNFLIMDISRSARHIAELSSKLVRFE